MEMEKIAYLVSGGGKFMGIVKERIIAFFGAIGLGLKIAFAFVGLAALSIFAYGRKQRALGAAKEKAELRGKELDAAAKSGDAAVQDYIERRYKEDK